MENKQELNIAEYILALLIILEGNSVFNVHTGHYPYSWGCCFATILLGVLMVPYLKNVKKELVMAIFTCYSFFVLIQWMYNGIGAYRIFEFIGGTSIMTMYFSICYEYGRVNEFWNKVSNIIFILSIASIVLWVLGPVLNIINSNVHISNANWGSINSYDGYFNLLFEAQKEDGTFLEKGEIWRNSSIFAEAPMFNLWIDISLFYEMFLRGKIRRTRMSVYLLSIVTAMSSTGIIVFSILLFCKVFKSVQHRGHTPWYFYILFVIVVVGVYYAIDFVMDQKSQTGSYDARFNDFEIGYIYFLNNPLAGAGYVETGQEHLVGSSNTIVTTLARGGILLALLMLLPLVVLYIKGFLGKDNTKFSTAVFFTLLFTTIIVGHNYLFVIIIAYYTVIAFTKNKKYDVLY